MAEQLITLGQIDASDTLGTTLHNAALCGHKKSLKRVLQKGIDVDYPNDEGQSALFCACLAGRDNAVEYLLSVGADPNEKSNLGLTPVHVACYTANVKSLMKLLNEGGDLRLHDYQGRGVKDWAMLHPTPKRRMKILEFLDKTRLFAMSNSGQDLLLKRASSHTINRAQQRKNSITQIIRDRIGRPSVHGNLENMALSHNSIGFGQVYAGGKERSGFLSAIPLVCENNLRHDMEGETYNNGAFCVMESMWWEYTQVTVKKLHRDVDPYHGGVVDLLINEIEQIGKLRHPNVLTLMGVCQTSNLDALILLYEPIAEGSLYNYLHQKMERLPNQMIREVAIQMCNAIIFIHLRGLVHCGITSHAISVVNGHTFKLANFEYMVELSKCELGKKNSIATNTVENSVYNWMAPEIMLNLPPSYYCDMYSYCAVLWEIFHGEVPFGNQCSETIKAHHQKGHALKIYHGKIAEFYKIILDYGLQHDPNNRKLSFLHVRDLQLSAPKDASQYVRAHFQHLQQNDNASVRRNGHGMSTRSGLSNSPAVSLSHQTTSNQVELAFTSRQDRQRNSDTQKTNGSMFAEAKKENRIRDKNDFTEKMLRTFRKEKPEITERRLRKTMIDDSDEDYEYDRTRQVRNSSNNCSITPSDQSRWADANATPVYKDTPKKSRRSVHYQTDSLQWEGKSESEGDDYKYLVTVQNEVSPQKQETCETEKPEEVTRESNSMKGSSDDLSKYAKGAPLQKKTSSMGGFSFLNLPNHQRARSSGAKPACHGQSEPVCEEFSTIGKLTTAGSLYALYNDHSPELPLGQPEYRPERHPVYTLPRPRKPAAPLRSPDPAWFGGRGSVRDLAAVYQNQIFQHGFNQAVLDGKLNSNCSSEPQTQPDRQEPICKKCQELEKCGPAETNNPEPKPPQTTEDDSNIQDSACSLTTVTVSDTESDSFDPYQITYDLGDDTSSTFTSGTNIKDSSSMESDLVSKWVDHEIRKIGRKLSKDVILSHNKEQGLDTFTNCKPIVTPDLFDRSSNQNPPGPGYETTPSTSDQNVLATANEAGDQEHYVPEEYTYFDDEVYGKQLPSPSRSPDKTRAPWSPYAYDSSPEKEEQCSNDCEFSGSSEFSPYKSSLPMNSVLIKTAKDNTGKPNKDKRLIEKRQTRNKSRSRIPTSKMSQLSSQKSLDGAYANIVTVRSSLDNAGVHSVTHEMKNLATGGRKTIATDTVKAKKITTTFKAPN